MTTPNAQTNGVSQNGTAEAQRAQAWSDAIDAVVVRARNYYGKSFGHRITKARHYLMDDQLEVEGEFGCIPSESDPDSYYTVSTDGCDCQDAEYTAPQGMCAHRLAWDIFRGAYKLMHEQAPGLMGSPPEPIPDPYADASPDEPLAEAPISICMKGTLAGMPGTLVTIRGRTMAEIAARAAQVKAQAACLAGMFDAETLASEPPEEPPEPAASPDQEEEPYCDEHDMPFFRHEKSGQVWWSHKVENPRRGEKTWCRYQP